jgi:hypothetical protein
VTEDWNYQKAKIEAQERQDKRTARLVATGIVAGAIVLLALIGTITYGAVTAAKRDAAFKEQCMEKGGVVAYYQCYYTNPQEG